MPFRIIRNDITKVKADAIVNPANPEVCIGGGVESAIYKAAGKGILLDARKELGLLQPGEVGVTKAFNLDAKYIVHVSGPWWKGGNKGEIKCLRDCYEKALTTAKNYGCESIVFPLLATGTYGFPKEVGIQIAVDAFTKFLEEYEMEITLVVFESEAVSISGKLVEEVRSFIDDRLVEEALVAEYSENRACPRNRRFGVNTASFVPVKEDAEETERLYTQNRPHLAEEKPLAACLPKTSLEDALKNIYTDSFEKHLQKLINKKGLKNSEVYAAANISKQYFSKLLKGQVKPSKEKMLALAVGLRLNMDETVDFLRIAGYALSPISQTDTVVEYFIRKQEYNVLKIDIVLFDYGLEPLSNV